MSENKLGKWTANKNVQLIRAFRSRPVLWDPLHVMFYHKLEKLAAWNDISVELNSPPDKCKFKMITLMSGFRREKAKFIRAMQNGDTKYLDLDRKLRYSWYAFKEMGFMMYKDIERIRHASGQAIEETSEIANLKKALLDKKNLGEGSNSRKKLVIRRMRHTVPAAETSEDSMPEVKPEPSSSTPVLQQSQPATTVVRVSDNSSDSSDSNHSNLHKTKQYNRREEINYFANFIASKMQKYTDATKNAVQKEICDIIFRADKNYYETVTDEKFTFVYDPLDDVDNDENKAKKAKYCD